MRIVFMGTPDFAVPCLEALLEKGHEICGVFTQPDKPKGRKYVLTPPPVKELALEKGLTVYQPKTLRTEEAAACIRDLAPDCIVVVAYGKILPKGILEIPTMGCINVHGSLLPKYRGAAPIQWAVINGEKVTGVTTMFMAEGLDTGDMLLRTETEILPDETAGELFDRLAPMGADLLVKTLDELEKGSLHPEKQKDEESCYAPQLSKETAVLDWSKPADCIYNKIRGMNPWPVAHTFYKGQMLKIYSSAVSGRKEGVSGEIFQEKGRLYVCCGDGTLLEVLELQCQGKKRMQAGDFLRGHSFEPGERFELSPQ